MNAVTRAVSAALVLFFSSPAQAHWWYSAECCGEKDCREAAAGEIVLMPDGWLIVATGKIVAFDAEIIRTSLDDKFHVCTLSNGKLRCLYIPEAQI